MKTHFFLKALAEGEPDGCGKKVQMDFDVDFGFSAYEEEQTCEDLATCFSNFLHSLGYYGWFRYQAGYREPEGNPSMAYNPDDNWATQPEDLTLNLSDDPEVPASDEYNKEGTNGK